MLPVTGGMEEAMKEVPKIRPVSDLRNNFKELSNLVKEVDGPVYLTKNGAEDMVIMSHEAYEREQIRHEIDMKIREGEIWDEAHPETYLWEDVYKELMDSLKE